MQLSFQQQDRRIHPGKTRTMDVKYDKIGTGYNATRQADSYLTERLFDLLKPKKDKLYLDIGCGTGNYTSALANKGIEFIGVEPSEKMLNEAKQRNQNVTWLKGTAEQIPAGNQVFDGIIATLTIHHWPDLTHAFNELNRVLSDAGRIVIFTSTAEQMQGYWLNHYFPKMLKSSVAQMPSLDKIKKAIEKADLKISGNEKYFVRDDLQDCFLYVGKNRPEQYFDEKIRNGISSFSDLANIEEVNQGLIKLRSDKENITFDDVKLKYENNLGDYLFIVVEKEGHA